MVVKEVNVLENRIIKVKPTKKKRAFFPEGHDGEHTYTGCFKDYGLPYDSKKRSYVNPFLEDGEQSEFERLLNQKPGALNLYDFKSKFWGEFSFSFTKEGDTLNLMNPIDALWYRIFLVSPKFANSPALKKDPRCDFFLEDEVEQEIIESKEAEVKEEALTHLMKIIKSRKKMVETLRLLGKKPSADASPNWLKKELIKIIEEPGSRNVLGINDFLKVVNDPRSATKLFVLDALDNGDITKDSRGLWAKDFNKYLGKHLEEAVSYFEGKDPEVIEMKQIIDTRLKS